MANNNSKSKSDITDKKLKNDSGKQQKPSSQSILDKLKNPKVLLVITTLLLVIFGIIIVILLIVQPFSDNDNQESSDTSETINTESEVDESNLTPTPTENVEPTNSESSSNTSNQKRIAYTLNQNIWIVNADGTEKFQLTNDASNSTRYTSFTWKDRNILTYSKCTTGCKLYNYDANTDTTSELYNVSNNASAVSDVTWKNDTTVGYIWTATTGGGAKAVQYNTDTGAGSLIDTYSEPPARGGGFNDGVQISFSPDEGKILVWNTLVTLGDPTVYVYDRVGNELTTVDEAFFPIFKDNDELYLKKDGRLQVYDILGESLNSMVPNNGYDYELAPSGNFISYWERNSSDEIDLFFHDVAGSPAQITDAVVNARWINDSTLVGIKTSNTFTGMGYEVNGIVRVDRVSGSETSIISDETYYFELSP